MLFAPTPPPRALSYPPPQKKAAKHKTPKIPCKLRSADSQFDVLESFEIYPSPIWKVSKEMFVKSWNQINYSYCS